jgi:hypothetical protein
MTLVELRAQLHARGGAAEIWLVYLADPFEEVQGGRIVLALQRAFWTRGEAYAFGEASRQARRWQQFYIFTLTATEAWSEGTARWTAKFETEFGRPRPLPVVSVRPTELASAFGDSGS